MKNQHLDYSENSDLLFFENYNYLSDNEEKENLNKKIMKRIMLYIIKYELTDRQRTIFMMRHIEAKTAAQIAAEMGIEAVTVYKHLSAVEKCLMRYCEFFSFITGSGEYMANLKKDVMSIIQNYSYDEDIRRVLTDYYMNAEPIRNFTSNEYQIIQRFRKRLKKKYNTYIEIKRVRQEAKNAKKN